MKAIDENTAEGRLSRRDIAHILAALRTLQAMEQHGAPHGDALNELVHGEGFELFEPEEYDELCERLNFRDYATPYSAEPLCAYCGQIERNCHCSDGERGSISLPLLTFQACAAVGVASALWSLYLRLAAQIGGFGL